MIRAFVDAVAALALFAIVSGLCMAFDMPQPREQVAIARAGQ